ncbi:rRNA cytosine-C5-methyltransferase [Actinomycetes bacterium]|nr:rRNA cytosine-C5-methyltransferase [Actinomycetes bacterium]
MVEARRNTFKAPKPDAVRLLAFDLITEVNRNEGYSNLLLPAALSASSLEDRDRNLVTELVYGTLRMQGKHDWVLTQVSDRPWNEVDSGIVDVARMGVHQIHELRIPDHAAVSATVEIARKRLGESKASFVNALLRSVTRKSYEEWFAPLGEISDVVERLSIQYSHPHWIISAYFDLLKDWEAVEAELATNNVPALPTLVSWPGYSTQAELVALGAEPTMYSQLGARLKGNPGNLDVIKHRLAGVQDEGSQLVASIFAAASAGDSWLDMCAGPGGKAALLSSIAKERAIDFTANEFSAPRAELVKKVVHGATVWCGDGREIASHGKSFDAVIIDAPCTGLGALRRRPEVRWRRSLTDLRGLTSLQRELLDSAVSVMNSGAILGYATCSPHLAETTVQVIDILKKYPELEQLDIHEYLPENLKDATRGKSMSLWTHKHGTDAMFLALLRKK